MDNDINYRKALRIKCIEDGITIFKFFENHIQKFGYTYSTFSNCLYGTTRMKEDIKKQICSYTGLPYETD